MVRRARGDLGFDLEGHFHPGPHQSGEVGDHLFRDAARVAAEARQQHPALASDLLEEFRTPIVDGLVLALANRGQFSDQDFYFAEGEPQPCLLKDESRLRFLEAFEEKLAGLIQHPDLPHPVDWRRVLDLQVLRYRRYIEGSVDRYIPFTPK